MCSSFFCLLCFSPWPEGLHQCVMPKEISFPGTLSFLRSSVVINCMLELYLEVSDSKLASRSPLLGNQAVVPDVSVSPSQSKLVPRTCHKKLRKIFTSVYLFSKEAIHVETNLEILKTVSFNETERVNKIFPK